jgi:hypothetical protein
MQSDELKFCKSCGANLHAVRRVVDTQQTHKKHDRNKPWFAEMAMPSRPTMWKASITLLNPSLTVVLRRWAAYWLRLWILGFIMFVTTMMALTSVLLLFYGSVCVASPEYARRYHLQFFRTKEPENWYDRLFYLRQPPPLALYRVTGLVLIFVSLCLAVSVYRDLK